MKKIHIIGASFAGMACARKLATLLPNYLIVIIDKEEQSEYIPNGLNELLQQKIKHLSESTWDDGSTTLLNIVRITAEVIRIHTDNKYLQLRTPDGQEKMETYQTLVCAMGATAKSNYIKGSHIEGVMTTKSFTDSKQCLELIEQKQSITIIGAGIIGLELAYSLDLAGKDVTILEATDDINFSQLDKEMIVPILENIKKSSVKIKTNARVNEIQKSDDSLTVITDTYQEFTSDMVILAVNFRPNSELLEEHQLCHFDRTVKVNDQFQTPIKDIYAIGDLIALNLTTINGPYYNPLINKAIKTGEKLAYHLAGIRIPKIEITKVMGSYYFGYYVSSVGLTEEEGSLYHDLVSLIYKTEIKNQDNSTIWIKLIAQKESGILMGAQIISRENHFLLTNQLSQALQHKLKDVELAFQDFIYSSGKTILAYTLHQAMLALFEKRSLK